MRIHRTLNALEKRNLGYLIHKYRLIRLEETKTEGSMFNTYTKDNFCEQNKLCHFHTLTKLETDMISDESVYFIFLKKLDLFYEVTFEEHKQNLDVLNELLPKLLHGIEYIDESLLDSIKNKLDSLNLSKDCIANEYARLFFYIYKFAYLEDIEDTNIIYLEDFLTFYNGIYLALAHHCLGIYYLKKWDFASSKSHFDTAKEIYQDNKIREGVINHYNISIYMSEKDYYRMYKLSKEMEKYYLESKNYKRLYHVNDHIYDYYIIHNSFEEGKKYYEKNIDLIKNNKELERIEFMTHYNFGLSCFSLYKFEEALMYVKLAHKLCDYDNYKMPAINMLLILMTKFNHPESEMINIIQDGEKYFNISNEYNQLMFKYFKYKFEKSTYFRRFALEQVIPYMKKYPGRITILLFLYQDLYE